MVLYASSFAFCLYNFFQCKEEGGQPSDETKTANFVLQSINLNGKDYTYPFESEIYLIDALAGLDIKLHFNEEVSDHILSIRNHIVVKNDVESTTMSLKILAEGNQISLSLSEDEQLPKRSVLSFSIPVKININSGGIKVDEQASFIAYPSSLKKLLSDEELLSLVQQKTFAYFWEHAGKNSGMARERSNSSIVTTGGTGFGVMAMLGAVERNFITRVQARERIGEIVSFLKNTATRYHGMWPHWIQDATGKTKPFSPNDDGADIVESAFLMQGLLCAQAYLNENNAEEKRIRDTIQQLWEEMEWTWFQQESEKDVLYWHWSPSNKWVMNLPVRGWNESLIVYVLSAASPTYSISKQVYDNGWAGNGSMKSGRTYKSIVLPLGRGYGGPLFFSHYSFLGLDPRKIADSYSDYWQQTVAHTKINRAYCIENPKKYKLYSAHCWGLTASDGDNGYSAHSPSNDKNIITPTAALSSFPYAPKESLQALRYFYYVLGDLLWKEYGFKDAINTNNLWVGKDYLAIDQGPIVVMIENYRTQLLWNLFMKNEDIQNGLKKLGFTIKETPEKMDSL